MCLAIPGKVIEIEPGGSPVMGKAEFGGIRKRICLDWVPGVRVGEYVIVHVGFAISRMDEKEAMNTLEIIREAGLAGPAAEGGYEISG
ncbi:MAG TPA: HypC/HybG/HupF family hydrogenase formation chaperone [Nitrospiria bacterium]|nr:HypC/HybG/HupF family hydrogenase formation chaperone [Nitrospiria bacterium]